VRCNTSGSVNFLDLSNNRLVGSLPESLGVLTTIESLDLGKNSLRGALPASLSSLTALKSLRARDNQLDEALPDAFGGMQSLTSLYLYNNKLPGNLPPSFGQLAALVELLLDNNRLSGQLDEQLFSQALGGKLMTLTLDQNALRGTLPTSMARLTMLKQLQLARNSLTCTVPAEFKNGLLRLTRLELRQSGLCGDVPTYHGPDDGELPPCPEA
jgi:Leucine-rich repeat (LRR) protein